MLNYIKAELYKACHRTYFFVFVAIVLGLEFCFLLTFFLSGRPEFFEMLTVFKSLMPVGFLLIVALEDLVFSGQYRHNTLKNECSFGISRARIYLGKLYSELLLALGLLILIVIFYLVMCWIFFPHGDWDAELVALNDLWYQLAAATPLWISSLTVIHLAFFSFRNDLVATTVVVLSTAIGIPILLVFQTLPVGLFQAATTVIISLLPNTRMELLKYGSIGMRYLLENWLIAAGWFAATLAIGIPAFQRRAL